MGNIQNKQIVCSKCQELKIKLVEAKTSRKRAEIRARLRSHTQNKHMIRRNDGRTR